MFVVALPNEAKASDVTVALQGNFTKKIKMQSTSQHEIIIVIKRTFYILQFFKSPATATVSMLARLSWIKQQ